MTGRSENVPACCAVARTRAASVSASAGGPPCSTTRRRSVSTVSRTVAVRRARESGARAGSAASRRTS